MSDTNTFTAFKWKHLVEGDTKIAADRHLDFAERVFRVASGVETILEIAREESIADDLEGHPRYLGRRRIDAMLALAQESMVLLSYETEQIRDGFDEAYNKNGRMDAYLRTRAALKRYGELPESI